LSELTNDPDVLAAAVGRVPSGCAILTATHAGRSTGMLASWFQQVSFEPLAICACVKPERPITSLIEGSGRFVLNVLAENPRALFRHFGRGFNLDEDAFQGVACGPSGFGPVLHDGVVASLACSVLAAHPCGDHRLYVARVDQAWASPDQPPYYHLRRSGASY